MTWFDSLLKQTSIYWDPPIRDGLGGYSWGEPIEIYSRWENRQIETKDETGTNIVANTIVWTSEDLIIGGYLMLGKWREISSEETPPFKEKSPPLKEDYFGKVTKMPGELYQRRWAHKIINIIYMSSLTNTDMNYKQLLLR